jgi:hypothetical protein
VKCLHHCAAAYLNHLCWLSAQAKVSGPTWSLEQLEECVARVGPHSSAKEYAAFVHEEMANFCDKGFWTVLPFDLVKDLRNLWLSPLNIIPQCEQCPWLNVDLSFWGINDESICQAPPPPPPRSQCNLDEHWSKSCIRYGMPTQHMDWYT